VYFSLRSNKRKAPTFEAIHDIINEAEAKSEKVCEICGDEGSVLEGGWLKCLCYKCNDRIK